MKDRIKKILTNLESVKEDLLALSDDIWLSIDHNDSQAVQRGAEFKVAYNKNMHAFTADSDSLSRLVQNFTDVSIDSDDEKESASDTSISKLDHERLIQELDHHTPHSLHEDFRYKRPFGFTLEGLPYMQRSTWSQVYTSVCRHLAKKSPEQFQKLPDSPDFISSRGNRSFSRSLQELRIGNDVGMGIFAEFNLSANQIRDVIKDLLTYFQIPHGKFLHIFAKTGIQKVEFLSGRGF